MQLKYVARTSQLRRQVLGRYCVASLLGDVDGCGDNSPPTLTTSALNSTISHVGIALTTTGAATAQYFVFSAPSMMLQWPDLGV
jgi:hypothetical protein